VTRFSTPQPTSTLSQQPAMNHQTTTAYSLPSNPFKSTAKLAGFGEPITNIVGLSAKQQKSDVYCPRWELNVRKFPGALEVYPINILKSNPKEPVHLDSKLDRNSDPTINRITFGIHALLSPQLFPLPELADSSRLFSWESTDHSTPPSCLRSKLFFHVPFGSDSSETDVVQRRRKKRALFSPMALFFPTYTTALIA
jgi:hypothetical protein